jgi:hypothetical protein
VGNLLPTIVVSNGCEINLKKPVGNKLPTLRQPINGAK